ncbi:alpha/beta hydrolase [Caballeronia sordidicola]|uniref:Alpha/beta hydrolase n=1 Tax=Caballeronia sordidicola TaxID=196367 RepID=A0A226WNX9_CABSO|nr:alpha/beta hydrolase [Caballeronia sordidicola]
MTKETPALNASTFYPGSDHAVLMLHGLSSSPLEMRHLARYLNSEGLTTCAPNLHGYSAGTPELRMEAWVAAAVREFDALSARYPRVSVCGLSMGATLALALVHERPTAQAIVLLSVTLDYDGWAMPWYRFLLGWAYYTPLRHRWRYHEEAPFGLRNEALRAKIGRAMQRNDLSEVGPSSISLPALHEASRLAASVKKSLAALKNDCLLIHAIDDETSSPRNAQFVAANVGSTVLRTIYLDDSYHMITSDNEREIVARETAVFLKESEAASSAEGGAKPVVSKALARRLRQMAAIGK